MSDPKSPHFRQRECLEEDSQFDLRTSNELSWSDNNTPESLEFGDLYYSKKDGLAESELIFLKQNRLEIRFATSESFTLAEFGFGVGLNFLLTRRLWRKVSRKDSTLHYLSFEKRPLSPGQIRKALSSWPELDELAEDLLSALPLYLPGFIRIEFPEDRLSLTLALGDAGALLPQVAGNVDAWFLDGFSPAKNPSLWTEEIFSGMSAKSKPQASFSTYAAASFVRNGLIAAGFSIERVQGFAGKREMLRGEFTGASYHDRSAGNPIPKLTEARTGKPTGNFDVLIVGAGMAGCAVAERLAARGVSSCIIDREEELASQASGNPAAILMPHLSLQPEFMSRFYLAGYRYLLRQLAYLDHRELDIESEFCGVLRLATSKGLARLWSELERTDYPKELIQALSPEDASEICGFSVVEKALYFPSAGWVSPRTYCSALINNHSDMISRKMAAAVSKLELDSRGFWLLLDTDGKLLAESKLVVLANAFSARNFAQSSWIPLERIRGQVLNLKSNAHVEKLRTVLCYDGFIIPERDGEHFVGATYNHDDDSTELNPEHELDLLQRLERRIPELAKIDKVVSSGRVAFRSMSPDRIPLVGPVADQEMFHQSYLDANEGRLGRELPSAGVHKGLYLSVGHGSRGLLSCALSAEILASEICGELAPIERDLLRACHPSRFLMRSVKRGLPLS